MNCFSSRAQQLEYEFQTRKSQKLISQMDHQTKQKQKELFGTPYGDLEAAERLKRSSSSPESEMGKMCLLNSVKKQKKNVSTL